MNNNSIIIPSKIPLTYHKFYSSQNLTKWKDQRLDFRDFKKIIIEILQNTGFTIEKILDSEPSVIADRLGIDSYSGELIKKETSKVISKTDPDLVWY
jgi:hypothetical protein